MCQNIRNTYMHTWVIYICILIGIYLAYQWFNSPSYYVRRMKYMMESLEPKEDYDIPEDIRLNTELWIYQYTSMYNMIAHLLERFDYNVKKWIHGFYVDFIMPVKLI